MDGARGAQRIKADDLLRGGGYIILKMPLGMPGFYRLSLHPGGESLIQPDVIPPCRGD